MLDGWQRRYDKLEDLFIGWITYPVLRIAMGKKAPPLKSLYEHRKKRGVKENKQEIEKSLLEEFGL